MENKLRVIDIRDYCPPLVRDTAEFQQIAAAMNPELNKLQECIYRILKDAFIDEDTTEYGVRRMENSTNITPENGESLDVRKARVLRYLNNHLPYTLPVLRQMLESLVGEGNVEVTVVNETSHLIVHTNEVTENILNQIDSRLKNVVPANLEVKKFNHNIELHWRKYNKYSSCKNDDDMRSINPDFKNDLTKSGGWYYDLSSYKTVSKLSQNYVFKGSPIKEFVSSLPNAEFLWVFLAACYSLENVELYAPNCSQGNAIIARDRKLKRFAGNLDSVTSAFNFAIGCVCLSSFECSVPSLEDATGMFSDCILDKSSVLRVCDSIPIYTDGSTHNLTLGIHVDYQFDEDVLAAINRAVQKGWTIELQWNGTPTSGVSTVDLEEVWCKVEQSDLGMYLDENNNLCTLVWGHDVSSRGGSTPSELGYKLFNSIEEAVKYFNIKEVIENE